MARGKQANLRFYAALLGTTVFVACYDTAADRNVSTVFHGIAPFDSLVGIHLGMTEKELMSRRPGAVRGSMDYSEVIGGHDIGYTLSWGRLAGSAAPSGTLDAVTSEISSFSNAELAREEYKAKLRELSTRLHSTPHCYGPLSRSPPGATWLTSMWKTHDQFVLLYGPGDSSNLDSERESTELNRVYRLTLGTALEGSVAIPEFAKENSLPCP